MSYTTFQYDVLLEEYKKIQHLRQIKIRELDRIELQMREMAHKLRVYKEKLYDENKRTDR